MGSEMCIRDSPECGKPLEPHDNTMLVNALEWKIQEMEKALEEMTKVKKAEEILEKK